MIYRRPPRVAFVFSEPDIAQESAIPQLHIKVLPDGEVHVMQGPAALIWLYAAEGHSDVPARVARDLGMNPSGITNDVTAFLSQLLEMKLLEPVEIL